MMSQNQCKGPLSQIILDEIALEGLEGLTIEGLWTRLSIALSIQLPLQKKFKNMVWDFLLTSNQFIEFYKLPHPRPKLITFDRFQIAANDFSAEAIQALENAMTYRFKINIIKTEKIQGSCETFNDRELINFDEIKSINLDEIYEKYDNEELVIVASQALRENVLFPNNVQKPEDMSPFQYCILEIIARSRYNGESSIGKMSITHYCKDNADAFYIRNRLCYYKLIKKQPYSETINNRIICGYLLTLTKFFKPLKSKNMMMLEKTFNILINAPNNQIEYENFKLQVKEHSLNLKKIHTSPVYLKFFEIVKVPYRTIFPDAPRSKWKRKSSDEEKQILVLKMKNKDTTLEDICYEENLSNNALNNTTITTDPDAANEIIENYDKIEFINSSHSFIDMPYFQQIYRIIDKHGSTGCTQHQILTYFGTNRLVIRALVQSMKKFGMIQEHWQDFGRQRARVYVAVHNLKSSLPENLSETITTDNNVEAEENTKDNNDIKPSSSQSIDGETKKLSLREVNDDILINIKATIREVTDDEESLLKGKSVDDKRATLRQINRKKLIMSLINERKVVKKTSVKSYILNDERKNGYKDEICLKSMYRILNSLVKEKLIKLYNITLEIRKSERVYCLVTDFKIGPNDAIIQDEINKLKFECHFNVLENDNRNKNSTEIKNSSNKDHDNNVPRILLHRRSPPKFLASRFFHEFLYYIIYDIKAETKPIKNSENIEKMLRESFPKYDLENLSEDLLPYYQDNINWKMFIPPLQRYENKPFGWIRFLDILSRIPLSMLMNFCNIDKESNPKLNECLNHPIQRYYLIQQLPSDVQDFLFKLKISFMCKSFLGLLSLIGLVQFGHEKKLIKDIWIYLNRKAKLLDTSISAPSYRFISQDKEYKEYNYNFNTFQDVQNYWEFLYQTCHVTPLGVRIDVQIKKRQEPADLPTVDFDQAPILDVGYIPGDQRGAAGLDSLLFAHVKSRWSWNVQIEKKKKKTKTIFSRIKLGELTAKKEGISVGLTTHKFVATIPSNRNKRSKNVANKLSSIKPRKKSSEVDESDRRALKRMICLRTLWTKDEDRLLTLCRAAYLYINNIILHLYRIIDYRICRDILHSAFTACDKTSKACQRRIRFIDKNKQTNNDKLACLHELNRSPYIKSKFGLDCIKNLKLIYKDDQKFNEKLKIYYVHIVYYLYRMKKIGTLSIQNECILPDTLKQLQTDFKETLNEANTIKANELKHFNPDSIDDIEISTINSIMHSTLCSNRDKATYNIEIFEIYKSFKEEILSKAFKKAKDDSLVSTVKGYRLAVGFVTGPSLSLSMKYRNQLTYLNIPYDVIAKCYQTFNSNFMKLFKSNTDMNAEKQSVDFKTINAGTFYFLSELMTENGCVINIQMPQKILTIDPTQKQNINDSERILEHFRNIFDNAPKTKYAQMFEEEENKSGNNLNQDATTANKPQVKFSTTNDNYILKYNPYNLLLKLSDYYLHFFCALDHLNKIIDLDFSINTDNEQFCPFHNCVLRNLNFIGSIEKIIHDKKSVIEDILRNNTDTDGDIALENIIILNQKNILQVFKKLQDELRKRSHRENLKDFGKTRKSINVRNLNILKFCKDLLDYKDINNDLNNDQAEFETTLNKEEKIIRAHDIFVVNLPTIKISWNSEDIRNCEYDSYKNKLIPKYLMHADTKREEILKKVLEESIWSNSGNIDNLKEDETFRILPITEQNTVLNVLNYIHTFPLGATGQQLMEKFQNENALIEATRILRRNYLIMRVGVGSFMYVHKDFISHWIIQTYNIKRLDKESLQGSDVTILKETDEDDSCGKRKLEEMDENDRKKFQKNEKSQRIPKPIERYSSETSSTKTKAFTPKVSDAIIMRPCPWIRVNASLNRRVLDRWLGSILLECLSNNCQHLSQLFITFNHLHPVNILCLLEILKDLDCIALKITKPHTVSLFSDYEEVFEEEANEFSNPDDVFIVVKKNAIINISIFIGEKKYLTDFV